MNLDTLYEKRKIPDRFLDILTLALFTLAIIVITIIVVDLFIYPISLFAHEKQEVYSLIIKYSCLFLIIASIPYKIIKTVLKLLKNGLNSKEIVRYIFKAIIYYITVYLIILVATLFILTLLYMLISFNQYLLYSL